MANRDFREMRQAAKPLQALQSDILPGGHTPAKRVCERGGVGVSGQADLTSPRLERARKRLRVQLHPIATDGGRPSHRIGYWINEQADPDPNLLDIPNDGRQLVD